MINPSSQKGVFISKSGMVERLWSYSQVIYASIDKPENGAYVGSMPANCSNQS